MTDAPSPPQQELQKGSAVRKHERHSCRLKMRCRRAKVKGGGFSGTEEKYIEGFVRNRSPGGYLLESPIYYPANVQLEIGFNSPDGRQSYLGTVTVKWTRRLGNAWYMGVAAEHMDTF